MRNIKKELIKDKMRNEMYVKSLMLFVKELFIVKGVETNTKIKSLCYIDILNKIHFKHVWCLHFLPLTSSMTCFRAKRRSEDF